MIAVPAAPAPDMHDPDVADVLAHHPQRVVERGQHDDRGAVLVVVEDRDVQQLAQPASISKQRGAEMSSRLMPAKPGATALTTAMISSVSWVSRHSGHASMPANRLNSAALPSITGSAAFGPMLPRPEHRRTVGDHGDRCSA